MVGSNSVVIVRLSVNCGLFWSILTCSLVQLSTNLKYSNFGYLKNSWLWFVLRLLWLTNPSLDETATIFYIPFHEFIHSCFPLSQLKIISKIKDLILWIMFSTLGTWYKIRSEFWQYQLYRGIIDPNYPADFTHFLLILIVDLW